MEKVMHLRVKLLNKNYVMKMECPTSLGESEKKR